MYKHHEEEQGMPSFQTNNPSEQFDIQAYMTKGVERVVSDAIKATLKNPRESAFLWSSLRRQVLLLPQRERRLKKQENTDHRF